MKTSSLNPLEEKALRFHYENPEVFDLFCKLALKGIEAGRKTLSAYQLFEVMRWEYSLNCQDEMVNPDNEGLHLKLNNTYRPYYARWFMDEYPEHEGIFRTRALQHHMRIAA